MALPRPKALGGPSGADRYFVRSEERPASGGLPKEMECGSGMTCWRPPPADWQEAGVWQNLHELLLAKLPEADQIDWSRAVVDSASLRAVGGGGETGSNPTNRRPPQAEGANTT